MKRQKTLMLCTGLAAALSLTAQEAAETQELAPALRNQLREIDHVDMRFDRRVYVKSKGRLAAVAE